MKRLLALISLLLLFGCAAGRNLSSYPVRAIDRPYTLPDHVAIWETVTGGYTQKKDCAGYDQVDSDNEGFYLRKRPDVCQQTQLVPPIPLTWEVALNDDWTLEIPVLPLAIRHQLLKTDSSVLGIHLASPFYYSSLSGFTLMPEIAAYWRVLLRSDLAIELQPGLQAKVPFGSLESGWGGSFRLGPMWQITDFVNVGVSTGVVKAFALGGSQYLNDFEPSVTYVPIGLNLTWLFHRQWESALTYNWAHWGLNNNETDHTYYLVLRHYW